MCGIVGFTGQGDTKSFLLDGLAKLEYRGYDSAGVAIEPKTGGIKRICSVGRVAELSRTVKDSNVSGTCGIGHTRWATHGVPSEINAHPHMDCEQKIAVVHNGIIENYAELRDELTAKGHKFRSQTDTEVIAHLIEQYYEGDFFEAMRKTIERISGAYAIAAIHEEHPGIIIVSRKDSPIVVASSIKGAFVASDTVAVVDHTRDVVYLEDDSIAVLHKEGHIDFFDLDGNRTYPDSVHIDWDPEAAGRAGFPDFMLKEIHEQPRVVGDTLEGRLNNGSIVFPELDNLHANLNTISNITIVGCGTSYHAGLIARQLIEKWARIPVSVEIASEFRYRDPIVTPNTLVVAITQSGETADTLEAMKQSRDKGAKVVAITNVVGSRATRESDAVLFIKAKLEVSVAATKSFLAQNTLLAVFALYLAQCKNTLTAEQINSMFQEMEKLPSQIEWVLHQASEAKRCAKACFRAHSIMYIGRGFGEVTCKEGALKLKEISYIHAEAYPAGEIKHGPIALIDDTVPVIAIATNSPCYDKMISNIEEVRARGAKVIALATDGDEKIAKYADYVMYIPAVNDCLSPITASVPLQLFARETALMLNRDVDKPRNLAKSVTVE